MRLAKVTVFFLLICLVPVTLAARPVQLKSFNELMSALKNGYEVRLVIHYGKCRLVSDGKEIKAPDAIGGTRIETFEYFAKNSIRNAKAYVVFSHASLINYKGYIYNYAKFKIYEDNTVEMLAQYAKPLSYRILMDETFHSQINDRTNDGAVYLFCEM